MKGISCLCCLCLLSLPLCQVRKNQRPVELPGRDSDQLSPGTLSSPPEDCAVNPRSTQAGVGFGSLLPTPVCNPSPTHTPDCKFNRMHQLISWTWVAPQLLSMALIKHHDQKQLKKEGIYWITGYSPSSGQARAGTLRQERRLRSSAAYQLA